MSRCLLRLTATATVLLTLPGTAEAQCAMCRQALSSPEAAALVAALRQGIALLILAPALAFGTVAFFAVSGQRRVAEDDDLGANGAE